MKVNVPFIYTARMVAPGKKTASNHYVIGNHSYDIGTLKKREIELAARIVLGEGENEFSTDYYKTGSGVVKPLQIFRNYASSLSEMFFITQDNINARIEQWKGIVNGTYNDGYHQNAFQPFTNEKALNISNAVDEITLLGKAVESTDRLQRLKELERAVSLSCIIDGVVYAPTKGPYWLVHNHPNGRANSWITSEPNLGNYPVRQGQKMFAAYQRQEAFDYYNRQFLRRGIDPVDVPEARLEVFLPDVFKPEHSLGRDVKLLAALLKFMHQVATSLPEMNAEQIRRFARLKELWDDAGLKKTLSLPEQEQLIDQAFLVNDDFVTLDHPKSHLGKNHPLKPFVNTVTVNGEEADETVLDDDEIQAEISDFKP